MRGTRARPFPRAGLETPRGGGRGVMGRLGRAHVSAIAPGGAHCRAVIPARPPAGRDRLDNRLRQGSRPPEAADYARRRRGAFPRAPDDSADLGSRCAVREDPEEARLIDGARCLAVMLIFRGLLMARGIGVRIRVFCGCFEENGTSRKSIVKFKRVDRFSFKVVMQKL